jgi:hypothetical protein
MNPSKHEVDELLKKSAQEGRATEEQRIRFHRLVKTVADTIRAQGEKARAQRASLGQANKRPLEGFEQRVLTAMLALGGEGELAAITARANEGAEKPSGDSAVLFTLSRLEGEGFTSYKYVRATEAGKAKVLFNVTDDGEAVLADAMAGAGPQEQKN